MASKGPSLGTSATVSELPIRPVTGGGWLRVAGKLINRLPSKFR